MAKQLFAALAAPLCLLLCATAVTGQTPPQNVVLIRHVRVADGEGGTAAVAADVLVAAGKLSRLSANSPAPAGAVVIDAGGGTLTLADDGRIKLTPTLAAASSARADTPRAESAAGPAVAHTKEAPTQAVEFIAPPGPSSEDEQSDAARPRAAGLSQGAPTQPSAAGGGTPQASQAAEPSLAAKVIDPTASLQTITFQNRFSLSLWGVDDQQNDVDLQLSIAHNAFGRRNVLRVTVPYQTSSPTGARGLTDVSAFNVVVFPKKWGALGAGAVASVGTNKGPGVNTFALGPAVGLIAKKGRWIYGAFSQNLFSLGDIAVTQLQPVVGYTVNRKVSLALGDVQHTYDWKKGRFVNVPLGVQANYIAHLGEQPIRLFVNPQYNLKNEFGSRKWAITTGFALIVR